MTERDPLEINGQTIDGKYVVERLVGEGGFAVVYRATHNVWNKPVAIKLFNGLSSAPSDRRDELKEQFIQEGALLSELSTQTASIVQARDVGAYTTPSGQWMPYMVLEWLEGRPLEDILEAERKGAQRPWSAEEAFAVLTPIEGALAVAHGRGIAHRDIKPANIFVCGKGDARSGELVIKLLDFGVAKMMSDSTSLKAALAKTGTNITSFTPQYGAPEQFSRSYGATGPWTDVFAMALVLVEMMLGRIAMDGDDVVQLAFSAGNPGKRPTPRGLGLTVNDAVEAAFDKALAVQPTDRFQNIVEFWQALGGALGIPVAVGRATGAMAAVSSGLTARAPQSISVAQTMLDTGGGPIQTSTHIPMTTTAPTQPGGKGPILAIGGVVAVAVVGGGIFFATRATPDPAPAAGPVTATLPSASAAPAEVKCPDDMATIPAGQFFMGSAKDDGPENEKPSHNVKLDAFCIDIHEVTTMAYKACSDTGACIRAYEEVSWPSITDAAKATYSPECNVKHVDARGDHPINCVTWKQASTFCTANEKRLPTEAEWEYATRGPDGRVYPWGDDKPTEKHLNACGTECVKWLAERKEKQAALYEADDGWPTTAPVGKYEAGKSRFGPYDVVGNVFEWVSDYYGPYTDAAAVDPRGPDDGTERVLRGGAWNGSWDTWLHPSFRFKFPPDARTQGIGFRCAKSLGKK